jgi:cytochrome P450
MNHGVRPIVASAGDSSRSLRNLADLPGPRGWPIVGNALQMDPPRLHAICEDWADTFGSVYRFQVLRTEYVAIADPELINVVLRDRPEGFRRLDVIRDVLVELGIDGVFSAEGLDWRRQRKLAMHALNTRHLLAYFSRLDQVTARLQRRWERAAASGECVDTQSDLMRFTVDVTSGLVFGHDLNTLERGGDALQQNVDRIFLGAERRMLAPVPYWHWFKLPADRDLDAAMAEMHSLVKGLVDEARARVAAQTSRELQADSFLDTMVAAQSDNAAGFTEAEIVGNALTMLFAGEDTTANTLSWMMHLMTEHPEVTARMQDEADRVLGAAERSTDYASTEALRYIEAATHEAMRLKPVAPLLGLQANADVVIGNVRVPKDTGVYLLLGWAAKTDDRFADAAIFRPERWLDDAGPGSGGHDVKAFYPFGAGPRFCPGRHLAMLEIKLVVAMLCRNFDIVRAPGSLPVREAFGFTMKPKGALVTLRKRRA